MSHGNQSYLRFSLEESVWFQKGQEVDELISISLDPNITIQESDQYVTIKGSLDLTGEYNREESIFDEEFDDIGNPKTVQTIEEREDGIHLFSHRFPVEVTIPKNRIQDLNDINVTVETFDYAFPEKSCIRLSADLMIAGLYGEQQHDLYQEQLEDDDDELVEIELEAVYRSTTPLEDDWTNSQSPFNKPDIQEEEAIDLYSPFEAEARKNPLEETENNVPVYQQEEQADVDEIFTRKETSWEDQEEYQAEEVVMEDEQEAPFEEAYPEITYGSNHHSEIEDEQEEVQDELEEEKPDQDDKKKKKKWKNKKSLTLSEFFARKSEEDHTRLKMCIVQSGETLDILSERYDVPVSQLQKVNRMELNQDIYEGQVLYIPISQKQR